MGLGFAFQAHGRETGTWSARFDRVHIPVIEIWDPEVSGDLIGLAMAVLALLVALALIGPSVRALVRDRRARRST